MPITVSARLPGISDRCSLIGTRPPLISAMRWGKRGVLPGSALPCRQIGCPVARSSCRWRQRRAAIRGRPPRHSAAGNGVDGDADRLFPSGQPAVRPPRAKGDGGEHEQWDQDARFAEHGLQNASSRRFLPMIDRTDLPLGSLRSRCRALGSSHIIDARNSMHLQTPVSIQPLPGLSTPC